MLLFAVCGSALHRHPYSQKGPHDEHLPDCSVSSPSATVALHLCAVHFPDITPFQASSSSFFLLLFFFFFFFLDPSVLFTQRLQVPNKLGDGQTGSRRHTGANEFRMSQDETKGVALSSFLAIPPLAQIGPAVGGIDHQTLAMALVVQPLAIIKASIFIRNLTCMWLWHCLF